MSKKSKTKTGAIKITQQEKFSLANRIMLDQNLSPATRLVGWYITDHINTRRGYAWPPQTKIAADLGLSPRLVKYAIKSLAQYFEINRSGRCNEYRIGAKSAPVNVQNLHHIGANSAPHPSNDPLSHPINSALAAARATPIGIGVKLNRQQRMTIFERKLKNETATDEEVEACGTLCKQVCSDPHATDAEFYQAYRLLENYELDPPKKPQPMERKR